MNLYLGSQSSSRRQLLEWAGIPFVSLGHNCDEKSIIFNGNPAEHVIDIAKEKMNNLALPCAQFVGEKIFVLTADTLIFTTTSKEILGKPENKADALRMLTTLASQTAQVETGCCLEVKEWNGSAWQTTAHKAWSTGAIVEFVMEERLIEWYLEKMPEAMLGCGAGILERYGSSFLKSIQGSYSAVLGLPLYELRQQLTQLNFFS